MKILSDYEEIFKIFEFSQDEKKRIPYENTYERLRKDLKQQYIENLDDKLNRWLSITKVPYFQDVIPVRFYIQAKMLYREGFYEAAITVSRGICEMICHNLLNKITHPFGTREEIEEKNFRVLLRFIATPKSIEKEVFENDLVNKITEPNARNNVKNWYKFVKSECSYHFKIENWKNTKVLFEIFEEVNFEQKDNFSAESFNKINEIYDLGNIYVHAKKNSGDTKNDAFIMVDGIGFVLFELYGIKDFSNLNGATLTSAYSDFLDICSGVTYYMEFAEDPLNAFRVHHNLPSQKQMNRLKLACGTWEGEWKNNPQNSKGQLIFYVSNECGHDDFCIHGKFASDNGEEISNLGIQLFGEYFRITGFKDKEKIIEFDLSFL